MSARQFLCAHYYDCAPSRSEFRSEFLGELLSSLLRQVVSFCLWQTEEQEIGAFFERLDLGRFVQGILNAGYTTFESLCSLSAQKLHAELGFPVKLAHRAHEELEKRKSGAGTQFTSFTRTKVQILTQKALCNVAESGGKGAEALVTAPLAAGKTSKASKLSTCSYQ